MADQKNTPPARPAPAQPKRSRALRAITIVIALVVLFYAAQFVSRLFSKEIKTSIIYSGSLQEFVSLDAILVRNEKLLLSSTNGSSIRNLDEGTRAAVSYPIVTVLQSSADSLLKRLSEVDSEILDVRKQKVADMNAFSSDIIKLNDDIKTKIARLVDDGNRGLISTSSSLKSQIDKLLLKKTEILGTGDDPTGKLKQLLEERNSIQAQLKSSSLDLTVPESGTVSYYYDNLEAGINSESMRGLTAADFADIYKNARMQSISYGTVAAGEPYAKLVTDNFYYIAVQADTFTAAKYAVGDPISVRINDIEKVTDALVEYISAPTDGKCLMLIRSDKFLPETAKLRTAGVDIILNDHTGLKIPLKSLTDVDHNSMTARVVRLRGNVATYVDVKIIGYNDEYAIIDNVSNDGTTPGIGLYNSYIVDPSNITDGQIIE